MRPGGRRERADRHQGLSPTASVEVTLNAVYPELAESCVWNQFADGTRVTVLIPVFGKENDPNAKVYASTNYIANGDSRKVAIEKLDAQAKVNADNIAANLVLINQNASDIADILASIGVSSGTAPIGVGICPLDADAKIPAIHLPDVLLEYKGVWDASTNTPTLSDATGSLNDWYRVNVAGTQDLGSGPIDFAVGDKVVHNGTIWEKWDTSRQRNC